MRYASNGVADANSLGGEIILAMDVTFFNTLQVTTINWQINAVFCEYKPNDFSADATLQQLTGAYSYPSIEYSFKAAEIDYTST